MSHDVFTYELFCTTKMPRIREKRGATLGTSSFPLPSLTLSSSQVSLPVGLPFAVLATSIKHQSRGFEMKSDGVG